MRRGIPSREGPGVVCERGQPVDRDADGQNVRRIGRLAHHLQERLHALIRIGKQHIALKRGLEQALSGRGAELFVTPQDIDQRVTELGRMVGYGITLALQRSLTLEDVTGLLG